MFPIVVKRPTYVEPAAGVYYLVAENGVFQVRDTPLYRGVTRVTGGVPGLLPEHEHLRLKFPRLPRAVIEDVIALFEEAYRRWRGEAMVFVFYRAETREFRVDVPVQTLPARKTSEGRWLADLAVRYGDAARPSGFVQLGTAHSHAELSASASGIDCADERYEDGLHIVFGSFAAGELSVSAAFVANGVRFLVDPADVLEPYRRPARAARPEWIARVRPQLVNEGKEGHGHGQGPRRAG